MRLTAIWAADLGDGEDRLADESFLKGVFCFFFFFFFGLPRYYSREKNYIVRLTIFKVASTLNFSYVLRM